MLASYMLASGTRKLENLMITLTVVLNITPIFGGPSQRPLEASL